MLVLSRKINQRIMIGNDVVITLKEINVNSIVLNITDLTKSENIQFKTGQLFERNNFGVRVVSRHGAQIKIGIQAPRDVPVHREEIFNRVQAELNNVH